MIRLWYINTVERTLSMTIFLPVLLKQLWCLSQAHCQFMPSLRCGLSAIIRVSWRFVKASTWNSIFLLLLISLEGINYGKSRYIWQVNISTVETGYCLIVDSPVSSLEAILPAFRRKKMFLQSWLPDWPGWKVLIWSVWFFCTMYRNR